MRVEELLDRVLWDYSSAYRDSPPPVTGLVLMASTKFPRK